jgi:hypothetical protein
MLFWVTWIGVFYLHPSLTKHISWNTVLTTTLSDLKIRYGNKTSEEVCATTSVLSACCARTVTSLWRCKIWEIHLFCVLAFHLLMWCDLWGNSADPKQVLCIQEKISWVMACTKGKYLVGNCLRNLIFFCMPWILTLWSWGGGGWIGGFLCIYTCVYLHACVHTYIYQYL